MIPDSKAFSANYRLPDGTIVAIPFEDRYDSRYGTTISFQLKGGEGVIAELVLTPEQKAFLIALRDRGTSPRWAGDTAGLPLTPELVGMAYDLHQLKLAFTVRDYAWSTYEGGRWLSRHE